MVSSSVIICLAILALGKQASSTTSSVPSCKPLREDDKKYLLMVFESALSSQQPDTNVWHHSVLGYQLLQPGAFPKTELACQLFGRALTNAASTTTLSAQHVSSIFHALQGAGILGDCSKVAGSTWPDKEKLENINKQLTAAILSGDAAASAERLYHTVGSLTFLKSKIDATAVQTLVDKLLKKDPSAETQGYIFQTVVFLNPDKKKLKAHFDDVEDVIQQADEADGAYLYYESGLFSTAFMVDAIYKLAEKYGEVPKIAEDKMRKLANYLLSRRYVTDTRSAAYLVLALRNLADNKRIVPACVFIHGSPTVSASSKSQPLRFGLTDVWGNAIDASLKAISITDVKTKTVHNKSPLDLKRDGKSSLYELQLSSVPLPRDHYIVVLGGPSPAATKGVQYVGITGTGLSFKVTAEKVSVGPIKLAVGETEGTSSTETDSAHGHSSSQTLETVGQSIIAPLSLDSHLKLRITIPVEDVSERIPLNGQFRPHQCFLRLHHDQSGREIIFVATPSKGSSQSGNHLQVSVDPSTQAKDFGYLSGLYTMELLLGDALMPQGVRWTLGKANIALPAAPVALPSSPSPNVHWADAPRMPDQVAKPEIHHMFRPADKRAPASVSTLFTVLCILPLGLLVVLWGKVGVNLRGLQDSAPAAIGFHICLTGIIALYYFYWTRWNMFTTLGVLTLLAVPTFLCGNLMLRSIAAQRLQEKKASGDTQ